eukprot:2146729-Pyramimonas_sp.AAC.1
MKFHAALTTELAHSSCRSFRAAPTAELEPSNSLLVRSVFELCTPAAFGGRAGAYFYYLCIENPTSCLITRVQFAPSRWMMANS